MKILVCGGRDFNDVALLYATLSKLHITHIVHGACKRADQLAGQYARDNGIIITAHPADWDRHGKAAGPIRNALMLTQHPNGCCI